MNMDGAIALLHTVPITNDASSVMEHLLMRLMRPALSLPLDYFQNRAVPDNRSFAGNLLEPRQSFSGSLSIFPYYFRQPLTFGEEAIFLSQKQSVIPKPGL